MFKPLATLLLLLVVRNATGLETSPPLPPAGKEGEAAIVPDAPDAQTTPAFDERAATDKAMQVLAQKLAIGREHIKLVRAEPRTWNTSAMGCGTRHGMSLQVITDGYAVTLLAQGRQQQVNVSARSAVICDRPELLRKAIRQPTHARGLDVMIDLARQDLADHLHVEPTALRLSATRPWQWPDNGLGCPAQGQKIVIAPVQGYVLILTYDSRTYTYHTDMRGVRACPAIESK